MHRTNGDTDSIENVGELAEIKKLLVSIKETSDAETESLKEMLLELKTQNAQLHEALQQKLQVTSPAPQLKAAASSTGMIGTLGRTASVRGIKNRIDSSGAAAADVKAHILHDRLQAASIAIDREASTLTADASRLLGITRKPAPTIPPTAAAVMGAASAAPPPDIPSFTGAVYVRGAADYEEHAYQYAFSSTAMEGGMQPAFILYPAGDGDVIKAVNYAKTKGIAIATRTGGHQYSGASSTSGLNIQLDMSETYPEFDWNPTTGLVRAGISHALHEFNAKLGENGIFVPHGQCSHVHLGGHVQTGGYGQLGRSFGLLADHVEVIDVITAEGVKRTVSRNSTNPDDSELFSAILGGSPGNFGILTHITIRPHLDKNHPKARGLKALYAYGRNRLKHVLDVMVTMANDDTFPADYDFCVTVLSSSQLILPHIWEGIDEQMYRQHPELYGENDLPLWPPMILIYAQWANLGGSSQEYNPTWFNKIKEAAGWPLLGYAVDDTTPMPMSQLTKQWVFGNVREFLLPYEKRTYMTNSKTLVQDEWTDWVSRRIDFIQSGLDNGCELSVQIQNFGGKNSRFRQLGLDGKTSLSWRADSTICCVLDIFYGEKGWFSDPKETAIEWQKDNDEGVVPTGKFCKEDRRVLWGSYGDHHLDNVWMYYYETKEKYDKLCAIKKKVDPTGVFTPNAFCVGAKAATTPARTLLTSTAAAAVPTSSPAFKEPSPIIPPPIDEAVMSSLLLARREAYLQKLHAKKN